MAIEFKDYYFILGVARSAGEDEIRKAFRKLARLYHPDIAGNDRQAEDRFKEINEAYEVLSDADKRRRYDDFNSQWRAGGQFRSPPGWENLGANAGPSSMRAEHFTFTGAGFSEFFDQLFGPNARQNFNAPPPPPEESEFESAESKAQGDDLEADIWVTLEEVASGATRPVTMRRSVRCSRCCGMGQYNAHKCELCDGSGHTIRADRYKVRIPLGVVEGTCLRVQGQGEEGVAGAPPGDLYLKVRYARHPEFNVRNGQLCYDLELAPWEAVLGTTVYVPTLKGSVKIKVPPGTQTGQKMRLRGKGLPSADALPGDLLVTTKIQVPREASEREQMLWRELAASCAFNPRDN